MNQVAEHYTKYHDAYHTAYGDVVQACRSHDLNEMLFKIGEDALLFEGLKVIDCGGGYGYPAAFFAEVFRVDVTSINITDCQLEVAKEKYGGVVDFKKQDYHNLTNLGIKADRILFLETLGHSLSFQQMSFCVQYKDHGALHRHLFETLEEIW